MGLCASSYMRTQPLFHSRHSPFPHLVLVNSVNLYGYEMLAFDRQVTGLIPTQGVLSLSQREGLLQHALQGVFIQYGRPQVFVLQIFV